MLSLLKRYRELICVGALLLYPLATFLRSPASGRQPNVIDRAVVATTAPFQNTLIWIFDGVGSVWSGYVGLRGVRAENVRLSEENAKLKAAATQLQEVKSENDRLRQLLAYADRNFGHEVVARIVGLNPGKELTVRINRGEADGVKSGMPVVTPEGVVGQVVRATGGWADVLLIGDDNSRVSVRVQRSRARATASGRRGEPTLALEYVLRADDLQENDEVVTAGTDGIFPAGLKVGKVSSVEKKSYGMFQAAQLVPSADTAKLEEVLVLIDAQPSMPVTAGLPSGGGDLR